MKSSIQFFFVLQLLIASINGQIKTPKDFGYQHLQFLYQKDTVDVLVRSKKGEEQKKKPVLFFVQGSLAKPLLKYSNKNFYFPSPLEGLVEDKHHLILVNKPGLPLLAHKDSLKKGGQFIDKSTGKVPAAHTEKNYLEYYVNRNDFIINKIKDLSWIDKSKFVVSGHSEGSSIAIYMAAKNKTITHAIYSGGTPYFPRILAMVAQERAKEKDTVNEWVEKSFHYWKDVLSDTLSTSRSHGWNSYKGTYTFSKSENEIMKNLNIPLLITYGTKDESCAYNDMFRIETIKDKVKHITFKSYVGLEHNFFGVDKNGNLDPNKYNWDKVVKDWLNWIDNH